MKKVYMNLKTGETGTKDEWWYENENGKEVNAVDLNEVVEVADKGAFVKIKAKSLIKCLKNNRNNSRRNLK